MQNKISVITPNYNYERYIGETIQSVIDQGYDNIEHLIIDDGSTDNSVSIIKKYQANYPGKIKLIEQKNHGQTYSINKGLEEATGDIICWINSDDTFVKDTFHTVNEFFIKNKDVSILFGDLNIVDINGDFIYRKRHLPFNFLSGCFNGFANIMSSNTVFWRKPLLDRVGLLDDSLVCNMDGEFFSRLTRNENVHHISKPFANFRREELSIAAYKYDDWRKIVEKEIYIEHINSYNKLKVSSILPYQFSDAIKFYYRFNRFLKRLIKMHYFMQYREKRKYRFNKN